MPVISVNNKRLFITISECAVKEHMHPPMDE